MEKYDLELDRIVKEIKKEKARRVCIQLPEGLKKKATEIAEFIEKNTDAVCMIYMSTCFGACDIPNVPCDLMIQFGHSSWHSQK